MSPAVLASTVLLVICAVGLLYSFHGKKSLRLFITLYGFYTGYNLIMTLYGAVYRRIWILALVLGIVIGLLAMLFTSCPSLWQAGS